VPKATVPELGERDIDHDQDHHGHGAKHDAIALTPDKIRIRVHRWYTRTCHSRQAHPPRFVNPPNLKLCVDANCNHDEHNHTATSTDEAQTAQTNHTGTHISADVQTTRNCSRPFKACEHSIEAMFRDALRSKSEVERREKARAYSLLWHPGHWEKLGADEIVVAKAGTIMTIIERIVQETDEEFEV